MSAPIFALVDCNNFFVSCERLFRPDLEGRPVVVLSSNDGCAVARSNEAKALGIPMGAPAFKYRELFKHHNVVQFSANFDLYGDISERLIRLLTRITPKLEVYSVDESFLDLSELDIHDYTAWGRALRQQVWDEIGIPVSIGIAPTKTLAKLASDRSKKDEQLVGVLDLVTASPAVRDSYCQRMPVRDVWGVGWRLTPKLKAEGVHTAYDLAHLRPAHARQLMGIHGIQMVTELNGTSCLPLERHGRIHKTIMRGRTFGEETTDPNALEAAIVTLAARAAYCLRQEGLLVRSASIMLSTNKHKPGYRRAWQTVIFQTPTHDTGTICHRLVSALRDMPAHLAAYRAGVVFHEVLPSASLKLDLFGETDPQVVEREQSRMQAFDDINQRYGKHSIRYASEDLNQVWRPRSNVRSPRYTTHWDELPVARVQ